MHATCPSPSHPPSFDHHNNIWQAVQFTNPIICCNCLHSPPTSTLLSPNTVGYATTKIDATINAENYYCPT
jgi:hypothetical protein